MSQIGFHEFIQLCGAELQSIDNSTVKGRKFHISIDSRKLNAGDVFWAIRGEHFDGHDYIETAMHKKAAFCVIRKNHRRGKNVPAVIVEDTLAALQELGRIHRSLFDFPVLALTGSNGKTTTKEMIAHVLSQKLRLHKTEGNLNNHIGCPLTLLELCAEHQAAVIEMGSNHRGEIGLLTRMTLPTHALITNIGGAHLEFFENNETIAAEKKDLFVEMEDGGTIFLNIDDPFLKGFRDKKKNIISYSLLHKAQVQGRVAGLDEQGCGRFTLNDATEIRLQIPGAHNIKNALAAAAVALHFGFSEEEVKAALESFEAADKRMQIATYKGARIINDAYNANPLSLKAALDTLAAMADGKNMLLVLGDMFELGTRSLNLHRVALKQALRLQPRHIFLMGWTFEAAKESLERDTQRGISWFADHKALASALAQKINRGDIVLIKGSRGMQMEKVLKELGA